jgi:hypothetical protein
MGVQEVIWDKGGTERAEDYKFLYGAGNEYLQLGIGFFIHKSRMDRMVCIILRGCWCHIVVLNVHTSYEDKSDDI